jgi:beta-lactamase regulating signal transducer with metallopeptidase domain
MPLVILRPAIWLLGMRSLIATALNAILDVAWKAATTLYLALGIWAWIRLQVVSRSWLRERVDDQEVRVSDRYGPGAYGFLRPTIVVPTWLLEIDSETRAAALIHEREHAERRDPLISAIGLLMFSIMPWNPVMGWQLRRLKLAIEMDCDTRVVRSNPRMDVSTYSNALIQLWRRGDLMRASDAMPGLKSHVKQRICAMQARLI